MDTIQRQIVGFSRVSRVIWVRLRTRVSIGTRVFC